MAFNYSPKVVTDGLILYLDAGNNRSYANGSTSWLDLSRSQINGSLANGATFNSANGGSIVFDGGDDFVYIPYSGSTSQNYTFNIVAKSNTMDSNIGNRQTAFSLTNNFNAGYLYFNLEVWGNTGQGFRGDGTNYGNYNWSSNGNAQGINFYTVTLNSTGHSIYLNGQLRGAISNGYISNFNYILLGTRLGNYWNGPCYQFSMYNRILSAQEILQNYNTLKGRFNL